MAADHTAQTTVVVPVWDEYVAARLSEALDSVRAQDAPARLIVVDNASEVALPELPGVELVSCPQRLSLGAARNAGLAEVQTPNVIFWDADDLMLPGTVRFLEDSLGSDAGLAAFGCAILEEPTHVRHRWPRHWIASLVRAPRFFAALDAVWSLYPTTGATIIRAELARAAGGFADADSGEDWCLGVSLAFRGRVGWSERPGRVYRVDSQSVWARHMTAGHQMQHARVVRDRIRGDRGIPRWARILMPLITVGQLTAILGHAVLAALRRQRRA